MSELKASIVVDLTGNLERQSQKYGQSIKKFSQTGRRDFTKLSRVAKATGRMLEASANRYTAIISGAVLAKGARDAAQWEERLERLGVQANKSSADMMRLREEIFDASQSPDIKVDPALITNAIDEIVEKTGDLKFARDNINTIGAVIQATGDKTGTAVGGIMAEFQKMGIVLEKDVLTAIDILNVQGKEGAFTLENLAALGPRVVTSYTAMGAKGVPALRQMGAVLQVIRQGTGTSEQAATSFEALMRVLGDSKKIEMLNSGGIKIFDQEQLDNGIKQIRPINEIMKELIERTNGDRTIIQSVLGDSEAVRAFNAAVAEFGRTGGVESLDKFMRVQADGSTTLADSARMAKVANASWQSLGTTWQSISNDILTPLIQKISELSDAVGTETTKNIGKGALAVGAGAVIAGKVLKHRRKSATAKLPPAPKAFSMNQALGGGKAASSIGGRSLAKGAGRLAGRAIAPLAVGLTAYDVTATAREHLWAGSDFDNAVGRAMAHILDIFGSDNAEAALAMERAADKMTKAVDRMGDAQANVKIELSGDNVKNTSIMSNDLNLSAYHGNAVSR